jgi:hypothetical protein
MRTLLEDLEVVSFKGTVGSDGKVLLRASAAMRQIARQQLGSIRELVRRAIDEPGGVPIAVELDDPENVPEDAGLAGQVEDNPLVQRAIEALDARVVRVEPRGGR